MAPKKEAPKSKTSAKKKERKPLTLHKHYLVDIRRYAKDLGITEGDFGKNLDTRVIKKNGVKYLALRIDDAVTPTGGPGHSEILEAEARGG